RSTGKETSSVFSACAHTRHTHRCTETVADVGCASPVQRHSVPLCVCLFPVEWVCASPEFLPSLLVQVGPQSNGIYRRFSVRQPSKATRQCRASKLAFLTFLAPLLRRFEPSAKSQAVT